MNSQFLTDLDPKLKCGSDSIWIIQSPLKYWCELLDCEICVPTLFQSKEPDEAGETPYFETDFASVPRLPIIYAMWGNKAHREAVLHDYLFRIDSIPLVTYSQANSVFKEAMKATGKPWYIYMPMYLGVCIGSWGCFHKRRVADKL